MCTVSIKLKCWTGVNREDGHLSWKQNHRSNKTTFICRMGKFSCGVREINCLLNKVGIIVQEESTIKNIYD